MSAPPEFLVQIASVPDLEEVVAEVWHQNELLAELRHDDGHLRVLLYARPSAGPWDLEFSELLAALDLARVRLTNSPPTPPAAPG